MTAPVIYIRVEDDTDHAGTWCDVNDGGIPYVPQDKLTAADRMETLVKERDAVLVLLGVAADNLLRSLHRAEQAEAELKTVLNREAGTHRRHDAKLDELEPKP